MECISKVKADLKNKIIYLLFNTIYYSSLNIFKMNNEDITDINKKKIGLISPLFSFVKRTQNLFSPLCLPAMSRARERNWHSFWSIMSSPGNSEHNEYLKTNPKLSCDFHHLPFLKVFSVQSRPTLQLPSSPMGHTHGYPYPAFIPHLPGSHRLFSLVLIQHCHILNFIITQNYTQHVYPNIGTVPPILPFDVCFTFLLA